MTTHEPTKPTAPHEIWAQPPDDFVGSLCEMIPTDSAFAEGRATRAERSDYDALSSAVQNTIQQNFKPLLRQTQAEHPGASVSTPIRPAGWADTAPRLKLEQDPNMSVWQYTGKGLGFHFDGTAPDGTAFETGVRVLAVEQGDSQRYLVSVSGNSGKEANGRNRSLPIAVTCFYPLTKEFASELVSLLEQPMVSAETKRELKQRSVGILGKILGMG